MGNIWKPGCAPPLHSPPIDSPWIQNRDLLEDYVQAAFENRSGIHSTPFWPDDFLQPESIPHNWWAPIWRDNEGPNESPAAALVSAMIGILLVELLRNEEVILLDFSFAQGEHSTELLSLSPANGKESVWFDWIRLGHGSFRAGEWTSPWPGWTEVSVDPRIMYLREAQRRIAEWPRSGSINLGAASILAQLITQQVGQDHEDAIVAALEKGTDWARPLTHAVNEVDIDSVISKVANEIGERLANTDLAGLNAVLGYTDNDWGLASITYPPGSPYPSVTDGRLVLPFLLPSEEGTPVEESQESASWSALKPEHQVAMAEQLMSCMDSQPAWLPLALIARHPDSCDEVLTLVASSSAEGVMEGLMLNPAAADEVTALAELEREGGGIAGLRHWAN